MINDCAKAYMLCIICFATIVLYIVLSVADTRKPLANDSSKHNSFSCRLAREP